MILENILLGMLGQPASGYDLKTEFSEGARYFWSAELSQIYPTLKRMEQRGWLCSEVASSVKGPPRRVYRRTVDGRKQLLEWLRSGPRMGTERFAYLAQLCFMHELEDLEQTLDFMIELRSRLADFLLLLKHAEAELTPAGKECPESLSEADFHGYLGIRMGIHSLTAKVAWCDEALERIRERQSPQVVGSAAKKA